MIGKYCYQCGDGVSDAEFLQVLLRYPKWTHTKKVCIECMAEIDKGADEHERNLEIQAMIEKALHFIADYGSEAWNTVVSEVVKQAK